MQQDAEVLYSYQHNSVPSGDNLLSRTRFSTCVPSLDPNFSYNYPVMYLAYIFYVNRVDLLAC
jgi:hypothetical protein